MKDTIRQLRLRERMTQLELAQKMGYSSPTIVCMWESGDRKPPSDKLPDLARALNCSIGELFGEPDKAAGE